MFSASFYTAIAWRHIDASRRCSPILGSEAQSCYLGGNVGISPPWIVSLSSFPIAPLLSKDAAVLTTCISQRRKHSPSQLEPAPRSSFTQINTIYSINYPVRCNSSRKMYDVRSKKAFSPHTILLIERAGKRSWEHPESCTECKKKKNATESKEGVSISETFSLLNDCSSFKTKMAVFLTRTVLSRLQTLLLAPLSERLYNLKITLGEKKEAHISF